ncbi:MAG: PqqD family protein, partial [Lachnospiraceae bacterium]|nr:PqqD family protein [Lachnospiraceae bacterium]
YILPFGQAIAELRRGILINEAGAFLWEQLQTGPSYEELLAAFASHYQATEEELPELKADMDEFLGQLMAFGILRAEEPANTCQHPIAESSDSQDSIYTDISIEPDTRNAALFDSQEDFRAQEHFLEIGGLTLRLLGPSAAFAPEFVSFACKAESSKLPDLTVEVLSAYHFADEPTARRCADEPAESCLADERTAPAPADEPAKFRRADTPAAPYLIRHPELTVQDCGDFFRLHFPQAPQIQGMTLRKDGSHARYICTPPFEGQAVTDLFHAIRIAYLYLAQKRGIYALHSASILYQGKAWLFSGQSGAGKSTHTEIWNRLFGVPILNGDLNLLTIRDGAPVVCGLPWCGTSGISTAKDYPLGGIILLKQARHNLCLAPGADRQILLLSQRFISPIWTRGQLENSLQFAETISSLVPVRRLSCTKDDEAAVYMKEQIDSEQRKTHP